MYNQMKTLHHLLPCMRQSEQDVHTVGNVPRSARRDAGKQQVHAHAGHVETVGLYKRLELIAQESIACLHM